MENEKTDGKACCDKKKCCTGKVLAAIALLGVGYFVGRKCGMVCAKHEAEKQVVIEKTVETPAAKPAEAPKKK